MKSERLEEISVSYRSKSKGTEPFAHPVQPNLLSAIVRTTGNRLASLDKALFSLFTQRYKPIEVILIYQGTDKDIYKAIQEGVAIYDKNGLPIEIVQNKTLEDKRAENLNLGIAQARGQYIAFLDDDDIIYPEHYQGLIHRLTQTNYAWAYSDVNRVLGSTDVFNEFYVIERNKPFHRTEFRYIDFWMDNFIPIHSFVIYRFRLPDEFLVFDEKMNRLEDYDFLLRLATRFPPSHLSIFSCEYRIQNDGSNTTMDGTSDNKLLSKKNLEWKKARDSLNVKKIKIKPDIWMDQIWDHILSSKRDTEELRIQYNLCQSNFQELQNQYNLCQSNFQELQIQYYVLQNSFQQLQSQINSKCFFVANYINQQLNKLPILHRLIKYILTKVWRLRKILSFRM